MVDCVGGVAGSVSVYRTIQYLLVLYLSSTRGTARWDIFAHFDIFRRLMRERDVNT